MNYWCAGQILSTQGRHDEAAQQYMRAAQLTPADYELVLRAATALRQAGRYFQAETFYRQAVSLRPHVSTLTFRQ